MPAPSFIYGTAWKEDRTAGLTRLALEAGFRAVDTANQRRHYVEAAVGEAVAAAIDDGVVTREDLFLQTKFTSLDGQDHRLPYDASADVGAQVLQSFEASLAHLRTSYVDSLVLHGPSRSRGLTDEDWQAWHAMEAVQRTGRARAIGASNVAPDQVAALVRGAAVRPAFVQNRCFARTGWDAAVREICSAHGIAYQGFSLLTANARELSHPSVSAVARRTGGTLPQVVFRFAMQAGMIPLTGTSSERHMREDLACTGFELEPGEVLAIERCGGWSL
jgi:diketogulonate reductase-like aldo/keto reductase